MKFYKRNIDDIWGLVLSIAVPRIEKLHKMGDGHPDRINSYVYSDDFQRWWESGYRECHNHNYTVVWHVMTGIECPKCQRI